MVGDRVLIGCGKGDFVNAAPDPVGMIFCLSLKDGKEIWSVKTGDTILGSIAVHESRAYAGSRDGNVYVVDVQKGEIVQKLATGAPVLSSPAVTADAVYAGNNGGKVFAFDRKSGALRATFPLTPGTEIISSPAIAGGKLFIGTRNKGVFALADRPADEESKIVARPWMGPGGDAGRTGCADDHGLPQLQPDKDGNVDAKWPTNETLSQPVTGPVIACGKNVYATFGERVVQIEAVTGRVKTEASAKVVWLAADAEHAFVWDPGSLGGWENWRGPAFLEPHAPPWGVGAIFEMDVKTGQVSGKGKARDPVFVQDLIFDSFDSRLQGTTSVNHTMLWAITLEPRPTFPVSLSGDKIFVTLSGKDKAKGFIQAHKLVDGTPVWKQELDEAAISYPVASGEWVAVVTADDKIAVFRASDGKPHEPIIVGGRPVAPALVNDVLIIAGHERIAAYDLSASDWLWNYKDQDNIGDATGQPVICNETIWVGTTKRGLVAIGIPPTTPKK